MELLKRRRMGDGLRWGGDAGKGIHVSLSMDVTIFTSLVPGHCMDTAVASPINECGYLHLRGYAQVVDLSGKSR